MSLREEFDRLGQRRQQKKVSTKELGRRDALKDFAPAFRQCDTHALRGGMATALSAQRRSKPNSIEAQYWHGYLCGIYDLLKQIRETQDALQKKSLK